MILIKNSFDFEKEVVTFLPQVLRYAEIMLQNSHDAEDLAQEVIFRALQKKGTYDPKKGAVSSWLKGFSIRVFKEYMRNKKVKFIDISLCENLIIQWETTDESEVIDALNGCIALEENDKRELLKLHYQKGYSLKKIAKVFSETVTNIKVKMHRIRKSLLLCVESKLEKENGYGKK